MAYVGLWTNYISSENLCMSNYGDQIIESLSISDKCIYAYDYMRGNLNSYGWLVE